MNKRQKGTYYERIAADYLKSNGCEILKRNYRCRIGEIDLIVKDGGYLVFVEVKYRSDAAAGSGLEAVDHHKQMRIQRAASWYMTEKRIPDDQPCRFDVISFHGEKMTIVKDAFQCS